MPGRATADDGGVSAVLQMISSLNDPFHPQGRASGFWGSFLKMLDDLKEKPKPPTVQPPAPPPVVPPPVVPPPPPMPAISVTGIIYDRDRPLAIVNSNVVSEGAVVDKVRIDKINKRDIRVSFGDQVKTIRVSNE